MRIDILCNDGSPLGVTTQSLWGLDKRTGVGGSEYYMLTLCEELTKRGHDVVLYNNPYVRGVSSFEQRNTNEFIPQQSRDILITWRSPNPKSLLAKGYKIWVSCDQYTVGSFSLFAPTQDVTVVISKFHKDYFERIYGIHNIEVIDIPIRIDDLVGNTEKVSGRCIFTSVPDRGLQYLLPIWKSVVREVPDASLVLTSDYRLWGSDTPRNMRHVTQWMSVPNIEFIGAVSRKRLISEQLKAELLVYPSNYDELFCVSVAEAQCCGVLPITSTTGALYTTNMGVTIPGSGEDAHMKGLFTETVIDYLTDNDKLHKHSASAQRQALERFHPDNILDQWEKRIFSKI